MNDGSRGSTDLRVFELVRDEDETGVSGTGTVAYGVVFPDGTCVLRWDTKVNSTVFYASITDLLVIHGHGGKTRLAWIEHSAYLDRIAAAHDKQVTPSGMTSGACNECGWAWPCPTNLWATGKREPLDEWSGEDSGEDS